MGLTDLLHQSERTQRARWIITLVDSECQLSGPRKRLLRFNVRRRCRKITNKHWIMITRIHGTSPYLHFQQFHGSTLKPVRRFPGQGLQEIAGSSLKLLTLVQWHTRRRTSLPNTNTDNISQRAVTEHTVVPIERLPLRQRCQILTAYRKNQCIDAGSLLKGTLETRAPTLQSIPHSLHQNFQ